MGLRRAGRQRRRVKKVLRRENGSGEQSGFLAELEARAVRRANFISRVFPESPALNYALGWDDSDYRDRLNRDLAVAELLRNRLVSSVASRISNPAGLWRLLIELQVIREDARLEDAEDAADAVRIFLERLNRLALDIDQRRDLQQLDLQIRRALSRRPFGRSGEPSSSKPFDPEDVKVAALAAEDTIEHTLARLFLRLGPPPESTDVDYMPAGRGGGGAQQ